MAIEQKPGLFYLGKLYNESKNQTDATPFQLKADELTTHAVILGMTGSGKTGLGIALLEEAGQNQIPSLIIDPKGDLGDLLLTFPTLDSKDFLPWVDGDDASKKGQTKEQYSETLAEKWKKGLADWGLGSKEIKNLKERAEISIYTPASQAGIPLSILSSFEAPPKELVDDTEAFQGRILSTVSGLLGLIGIQADPIKSREHILISTILEKSWSTGQSLTLAELIQSVQKPGFDKVGVFDVETFFPSKERLALSMKLNNLLASPAFKAWTQGEPLDIQKILYTPSGKPRLAILSIAHLSDPERMFFVTILLNELIAWMRRQSGTSSLKALLYMDEIFGFFPPTAAPPSKLPMITLLKQARAFGVGCVLATQNPVDIDYKGLSNCGIWFIGKLQTARDKSRVLEGMKSLTKSSGSDQLEELLNSSGNRIFAVRSVYSEKPVLFQTRWTLSYLKGPLTLAEIQTLSGNKKKSYDQKESVAPSPQENTQALPAGVQEFFIDHPSSQNYHAEVLGIAKLHFVDTKNKIDTWQKTCFSAPLSDDQREVLWDSAKIIQESDLKKDRPNSASLQDIPALLLNEKNYTSFDKAFSTYLYQTYTLDLFQAPDFKLTSTEGETEEAFKARLSALTNDKQSGKVKQIEKGYQDKINLLNDKIRRAQEKVDQAKTKSKSRMVDTFISIGSTLLKAFTGKGLTKGTVSEAGTSIRKAGRITQDNQSVSQAEDTLNALQQEQDDLKAKMQSDIQLAGGDTSDIKIEKTSLHPKKSDISIVTVCVVWKA